MVVRLDWDSEFLGYPTGCIRWDGVSDENSLIHSLQSEQDNFRLIYLFASENTDFDKACFSKFSIRHADTRLVFEKRLVSRDHIDPIDDLVENIMGLPDSAFRELALESGLFSRFRTDNGFGMETFERIYLEWLRRSVNGDMADACYAFRNEHSPAGLITVKLTDAEANVGLLSVNEGFRGKGIGRKLLYAAEKFALSNECRKVSIATQQANIGACRFYESSGYRVTSVSKIYHCWNHGHRFQ